MPRGGRRSSTWPKGKKPPVKRPKGALNKKTILKRAVGLQNWEGLKTFLETKGSTKMIKEIQKLKGKDYVHAVHAMMEYVKPKLTRVDGKLNATLNLKDEEVVFE
jgi:hypothetical protein